jgi:hypothetical protein
MMVFPTKVTSCVPPFEQLVKRGVTFFQKNISERLQNHSFINILFNLPFDLHQRHLRLCVRLGAKVWFLACLIIFLFHLPLDVFSITLCTRLGLSHPLILGVSHCVCN